jgi:hypothetical protein
MINSKHAAIREPMTSWGIHSRDGVRLHGRGPHPDFIGRPEIEWIDLEGAVRDLAYAISLFELRVGREHVWPYSDGTETSFPKEWRVEERARAEEDFRKENADE